MYTCVCVQSTHPNKEGLVSQSVAALRQVLNGHSVGTVAGWVVHAVLLQRDDRGSEGGHIGRNI